MNRRVKRTLCTGLAALMLAGCMTGTTVYAETAKEKVDRLEAALKQEKASLEKLQKDKKNAEATKTKLQNQSALLKEQLAALLETITDAEEAVGNKENEIAQKQEEIDSRWDDFKQQMGAMQMMHDTGAVAMLASCDSLYELLTFSNTMQEVSEWNTQVLDEMKAQRETLNEEKAKEELENRKAQLETKSGQLAANIQATDATITKAEADAKAQKEVVSMAQAEYDRAEAEWEAFVRQQAQQAQGGSSDFTSDMFIWPLPGYSTITTYFGETQNINGLIKAGHKGIDVTTRGASPAILAAAGGTVTVGCCYVSPTSARFVFKDCWDEGVMNDEATNKTGYFKSKGRKHVLEDIYPHIAAEWREIIAPRTFVETIEGERVEYSDPLWLPSATDVFGTPDGAWWNDGDDDFQLPVFTRERDRVKECGDKGTYYWWLRSVRASYANAFCGVTADGSVAGNYAYASYGFAPGFDI